MEQLIRTNSNIMIFGAGDVAKEVCFCMEREPYNCNVISFLVSSIAETTPEKIGNIPVVSFCEENLDKNALILVAVLEKYRDDICDLLDSLNVKNRIFLTFESNLWSAVRLKTYEEYCLREGYPYKFGVDSLASDKTIDSEKKSDICVYVTRSTKDKPIKTEYKPRIWEEEIYAGAALDFIETNVIGDNMGENISDKNRKYCELTAMYWMWKNTDHDYIGLSHYRRRFDFTDEEVSKITAGDADVILTTPVINVPSVEYMYGKNHDINDWEIMKKVVKDLSPDYADSLEAVADSNYYIPYNMFVMKKQVFDKYCSWLFPVLEECEKIIGDKEDVYQNRYIGFLAERLMTAYFLHHKDDYNIVFCNKHFLE
ncbi:DUF4422 domain-containing protein [Butyrivibrio sp. X503]|uniref:DUF4422 domain-containing protein n=1 Tax=Butyrivibrio sp. X503 TaxID=2364878 RepID=UPI000EA93E41|nr:DUF4422 domain-containing protein [Butyrivibrio sp. X503]RKM54439.1 DUF4422 domain-containing protein [Butyrivibrio sp. X503]